MNWPRSFSIISDEISQDLDEVVGFVRRYEFTGFELRSLSGRAFKDLTDADVAKVRDAAAAHGLRIHGCATPVYKCAIEDEAAIRAHGEIFKRSLDVARALDCRLLRVFTFLRRPSALDKDTTQKIAEHLNRLGDIAAGSGVKIGIENEASCIIGTDAELFALAPLMPAPQFGLIWDPCNVLYVADAPPPAVTTFERLLASIVHIHVKDAIRLPGRDGGVPRVEAMPVGLGHVNWPAHFAAIARSGYKGLVSLETHWRRVKIDEKLLHLPAGHAFSRGGAEASAVCLGNIEALCATG